MEVTSSCLAAEALGFKGCQKSRHVSLIDFSFSCLYFIYSNDKKGEDKVYTKSVNLPGSDFKQEA